MSTWFYDCDYGQGSVEAETVDEARLQALYESGANSGVRNVRQPTQQEVAFRAAMGGSQ